MSFNFNILREFPAVKKFFHRTDFFFKIKHVKKWTKESSHEVQQHASI